MAGLRFVGDSHEAELEQLLHCLALLFLHLEALVEELLEGREDTLEDVGLH